MEDLPNLYFMFLDRYEIHIQAFVHFIVSASRSPLRAVRAWIEYYMIVHFWRICLNSFFVFFQWFEVCFHASFLFAKRIHFWSSFSLSKLFLEPFLAHAWLIFRSFSIIFRSWAHFGSVGGQLFSSQKRFGPPKAPQ